MGPQERVGRRCAVAECPGAALADWTQHSDSLYWYGRAVAAADTGTRSRRPSLTASHQCTPVCICAELQQSYLQALR